MDMDCKIFKKIENMYLGALKTVYIHSYVAAIIESKRGILLFNDENNELSLPIAKRWKDDNKVKTLVQRLEKNGLTILEKKYLFFYQSATYRNERGHNQDNYEVFLFKVKGLSKIRGKKFFKNSLSSKLSDRTKEIIKKYLYLKSINLCQTCNEMKPANFRCSYCRGYFCDRHHLPEKHNCTNLPKKAPWFVKPFKPKLEEELPATGYSYSKHQFNFHSLKKAVFAFLKFVGFSVFTFITGLPLMMYLCLITVPEFASTLGTLGLLYTFRGEWFLWYILIPNLGYAVMWFFTVYKILRHRAEWWYHLVLLIFGLWSWWGLSRVILLETFLGGIFGG